MENILLLIISLLVCATIALPVNEDASDSDDPQNYKNIEILLLESAVDQDGGYSFSFENDDGSKVSQEGQHTIVDDEHAIESIRGSYSYNDVNGAPVSLTYTADENGFRPVGDHIPTPPPVPLEILRSLRFLATAKPFIDDQLYDYQPKKKVFRGRQYSTLNDVQLSRSSMRTRKFSETLPDETPREKILLRSRGSRQDSKPETTSQSTPETSSEVTVATTSESTTGTSESTPGTSDNTKKPAVETAADVVNEGKKKIQEALKETIEKTSKLTQSATQETADSAIAAIRDHAAKLTDTVKTQATIVKDKISGTGAAIEKEITPPVKESRGIIEEYTNLASDAVSDVDKALVDIAAAPEDSEVGLNVKVTIYFENDDGSKVSQEGQHTIVDDEHAIESIRGSYSYNDVNGAPVSLTYTADENGFEPVGDHIPTPPPVPLEILRSLRFLATAKPFIDDQLYDYQPKKKVFRGRQYSTLNDVQLSRSSMRTRKFSETLPDETPREKILLRSRGSRQDSKPETTSQSTPETSSEVTVATTSESTTGTSESTPGTSDNTKKPAVETAADVVNEGKKKIQEALKETIEKTSKLTQSATQETADSAIAAIRDHAAKLTDTVKTQATIVKDKISGTGAAIEKEITPPVKESRGIIEEYTNLASDAVSDVDKALVDIAAAPEDSEVGLNVKVTI